MLVVNGTMASSSTETTCVVERETRCCILSTCRAPERGYWESWANSSPDSMEATQGWAGLRHTARVRVAIPASSERLTKSRVMGSSFVMVLVRA